jgi:hypothetical protein
MVTGRVGQACAYAGTPNETNNATMANSRQQDIPMLQDFG